MVTAILMIVKNDNNGDCNGDDSEKMTTMVIAMVMIVQMLMERLRPGQLSECWEASAEYQINFFISFYLSPEYQIICFYVGRIPKTKQTKTKMCCLSGDPLVRGNTRKHRYLHAGSNTKFFSLSPSFSQ